VRREFLSDGLIAGFPRGLLLRLVPAESPDVFRIRIRIRIRESACPVIRLLLVRRGKFDKAKPARRYFPPTTRNWK
jgi:hypothetical protein